MPVAVITTAGAGTWRPPADCPAGTVLTLDAWGGGAGASGRVGSAFGAAGAGGAYQPSSYVVTPNDVANGIAYVVGAGSNGASGANPSAGGNSTWSTNNLNVIQDSTNIGAVVGDLSTTGVMPTLANGLNSQWNLFNMTGATVAIAGFGTTPEGFPYTDFDVSGTCTSGVIQIAHGWGTASASVSYTYSVYLQLMSGNFTNVTGFNLAFDDTTGTLAAPSYLSTPLFTGIANPTGTLTRFSGTATTAATTTTITAYTYIQTSTTLPLNFRLRIAGVQVEQAASASFFKSTPGYTLAQGGPAPSGTTGGVGSSASNVGTGTPRAGGNGAAFNAAGSGGGGAAGAAGAGGAGNTSGQGGQGDATTGGLGGAVKATSPGNSGVSNTEGGGGGGGLTTVAGTGGAGGAPGGGGGGAAVATGTGGKGGDGQFRITYTPGFFPWRLQTQLGPILAQ